MLDAGFVVDVDGFAGSDPKSQSSSCGVLACAGVDGLADANCPNESRPAQALVVCRTATWCCCIFSLLSRSTRAARSAMVMFARLDEADVNEPDRRPLNASPPRLLDFCTGFALVDTDVLAAPIDRAACNGPVAPGVPEREAEDEPAGEARMENASFLGAREGCAAGASEPSLRGCSAGLLGPVEFQRSANESDMARRRPATGVD